MQDSKRNTPAPTDPVTPAKKKAKAATDPPGAPKKKKVNVKTYVYEEEWELACPHCDGSLAVHIESSDLLKGPDRIMKVELYRIVEDEDDDVSDDSIVDDRVFHISVK